MRILGRQPLKRGEITLLLILIRDWDYSKYNQRERLIPREDRIRIRKETQSELLSCMCELVSFLSKNLDL